MSAHQAAATLQRAVASVQAQVFRDWELIIVNDGSTDATGTLARDSALGDTRIRVLDLARNVGPAAARNRAWRESQSPILAVLDADDIAMPERISTQTEFLSRHAEVSVLGSAAHFVDLRGRFLRTVTLPSTHIELARRRWHAAPFMHSSVMMRREFLEATDGYQEGIRLGEDYDLWIRGFRNPMVVYENLPTPLVIYRTPSVQRWTMIKASARVRMRIGNREGRPVRGALAALRVLTEGIVEQTRVFEWRDRSRAARSATSIPREVGDLQQ